MTSLKHYRFGHHLRRSVVWALALCSVAWLLPPAPARAQQPAEGEQEDYRELPVAEQYKSLRTIVQKLLREGDFGAREREIFDQYYRLYIMPQWSLKKNRASLVDHRRMLHIDLRNARNPPAHEYLNEIILDFMSKLAAQYARGNFHPASRVNAMLMIGELNQVESRTPVPLPAALKPLVDTLGDSQQPHAIKVAAMVGILRHAKLSAINTPAARRLVGPAVLKVVQSDSEFAWLRGQAAEMLGYLGSASVAEDLATMVGDSSLLFSARQAAAEALGKLSYGLPAGDELAAALRQLTIDSVDAESETISRRRIKTRIFALRASLKGVAAVAPQPDSVKSLGEVLAAMLAHIDNGQLDDTELMDKLTEEKNKLE